MIKELVELYFTPATPLAKKYGFLYHSISLKHRYERCKKSWLPHLKNCQEVFLERVASLPTKKSVVVLGAAHLHEIPLHLLVENFEQITLVDVIHPLKHVWAAKKNDRLNLITLDVAASLEHLEELKSLEDLDKLLDKLETQELFSFKADLVISGNLLSQLGLLPIEALEKTLKRDLTVEEKDHFCTRFGEIHLKNLKACNSPLLVYTDREVTYKNPQNEVIYQGSYPIDFNDLKKMRSWDWQLAPLKEASKEYSIEMRVEAYR